MSHIGKSYKMHIITSITVKVALINHICEITGQPLCINPTSRSRGQDSKLHFECSNNDLNAIYQDALQLNYLYIGIYNYHLCRFSLTTVL